MPGPRGAAVGDPCHGGWVDQRLSFVTLAVSDRTASRRFYVDGLGWQPVLEADDVVMFEVAPGVVLSLWTEQGFEAEVEQSGGDPLCPLVLSVACDMAVRCSHDDP